MSQPLSFSDLLGRDFSFFETAETSVAQPARSQHLHHHDPMNGLYSLHDTSHGLCSLENNKQLAHVLQIDNPVLFPSPPSTPMLQASLPRPSPSIYQLAAIATAEPQRMFEQPQMQPQMHSLGLDLSLSHHSLPRAASSIRVPSSRQFDSFSSLSHSPSSTELYLSNSFPKANYSHLQTMDRKGSSGSLYIGKSSNYENSTRYLSSTLDAMEQSEGTKSPKLFKCPRMLCSKVSFISLIKYSIHCLKGVQECEWSQVPFGTRQVRDRLHVRGSLLDPRFSPLHIWIDQRRRRKRRDHDCSSSILLSRTRLSSQVQELEWSQVPCAGHTPGTRFPNRRKGPLQFALARVSTLREVIRTFYIQASCL